MSASNTSNNPDSISLSRSIVALLRYHLGGRRGLVLLAVAVLGAGLYLNWGWLVAAGIAPLLVALAPCAAMCAVGLCMNRAGEKPGATQANAGAACAHDRSSPASSGANVRDNT